MVLYEWWVYHMMKKFENIILQERDGLQTSDDGTGRAIQYNAIQLCCSRAANDCWL